MQENKKIFQPKVIIGSITSFVIATIGIIAVFFPDLFNLQKKNVREYEIVLKDNSDAQKLAKYLEENDGIAIKLTLGYCVDNEKSFVSFSKAKKISRDWNLLGYEETKPTKVSLDEGDKYFKDAYIDAETVGLHKKYFNIRNSVVLWYYPNTEKWLQDKKLNSFFVQSLDRQVRECNMGCGNDNKELLDILFIDAKLAKVDWIEAQDGGNVRTFFLENGTFNFEKEAGDIADDLREYSKIDIPFSSNNNSNFSWLVGGVSDVYKRYINKENEKFGEKLASVCRLDTKKDNYMEGKYVGYLNGYFFVSKEDNDIKLEPISKKEFMLKEY